MSKPWLVKLLQRPTLLMAGVMLAGLWVLGLLFLQAEVREQRQFDQFSRQQMQAVITQQQQWLTRTTRDYAIWDDIARQLAAERHDQQWLANNFTESIYRNLEISEVLILDGALQPFYYLHDGLASPLGSLQAWSPELHAMLHGGNLQRIPALSYVGFLWRNEICYLVAVERIRPEHPQRLELRDPGGWLVFARRLDVNWKESISQWLTVADVQLWNETPPDWFVSLALPALHVSGSEPGRLDGAWLSWRLNGLADIHVRRLLGPAFWCALIVFSGMVLLLLRQIFRQQKEREALLARRLRQSEALRHLATHSPAHHEDETRSLDALCLAVAQVLQVDRMAVWGWRSGRWACRHQQGSSDSAHPLLQDDEAIHELLDENRIAIWDLDCNPHPLWQAYLLRHGEVSALAVAVRAAGQVEALLLLESRKSDSWTEDALDFAVAAADLLANQSEQMRKSRAHAISQQKHGFDPLTGLPSREQLHQQVGALLEQGKSFLFALLAFDDLAAINCEQGYAAGDQYLVGLALRLRQSGHYASRIDSASFVVLLMMPDCSLDELESLLQTMKTALFVDERAVEPAFACGVSVVLKDPVRSEELLLQAGFALQIAQQSGRGACECYDPEINAELQYRRRIRLDFPGAQARGELVVQFRPVLNLASGALAGAQVCAFWVHPELGVLDSGQIRPHAIDSGWMLEASLGWLQTWQDCSGQSLWLQLPVPGQVHAQFVQVVERALLGRAHEAGRLLILLAENDVAGFDGASWQALARMQAMGLRVVLRLDAGRIAIKHLFRLQVAGLLLEGQGEMQADMARVLAQAVDAFVQLDAVPAGRASEPVRYACATRRLVGGEEFSHLLQHWAGQKLA